MTQTRGNEGSSIRWQAIAIEQLGHAVGLFLSFSTATLGFLMTIIDDAHYSPGMLTMLAMDLAGLSLIASLVAGGLCVLNRLNDFRMTREIAREREKLWADGLSPHQIQVLLADRRAQTEILGEKTWLLFGWQIRAFALGTTLLILGFVLYNHTSLF